MIKNIIYYSYLILLTLSPAAYSTEPPSSDAFNESTLCSKDESVYFSCHLQKKGKIVSLCASENSSPQNGYIQYRYGTHENLELIFPKDKKPPKNIFSLSDVSEGSIRGLHVKFTSGSYTYVISSVMPSSIYVMRDEKIVFEDYCTSGKNSSFPFEAYGGIEQKPMSEIDFH